VWLNWSLYALNLALLCLQQRQQQQWIHSFLHVLPWAIEVDQQDNSLVAVSNVSSVWRDIDISDEEARGKVIMHQVALARKYVESTDVSEGGYSDYNYNLRMLNVNQ